MAPARICMLDATTAPLLDNVAPDVFDNPVDPNWTTEFLRDPRHHLAMAVDGDLVVGMASGVHYVHPDKAPEMWINEVGVAPTHRGSGLGRRLVERLCEQARALGCGEAWVLTDRGNAAAMRMYISAGGVEHPVPAIMFEFKFGADVKQS